jgi:hypothetical protein
MEANFEDIWNGQKCRWGNCLKSGNAAITGSKKGKLKANLMGKRKIETASWLPRQLGHMFQ